MIAASAEYDWVRNDMDLRNPDIDGRARPRVRGVVVPLRLSMLIRGLCLKNNLSRLGRPLREWQISDEDRQCDKVIRPG